MPKLSKRTTTGGAAGAGGGRPPPGGGGPLGGSAHKRTGIVKKKKPKRPRPASANVVNYRFRHPTVTAWSANRRRKTNGEAMGERGALEYLRSLGGPTRPADLVHPTPAAPFVPPAAGTPWPNAVAFKGNGVADVTWSDGATLHAIEAKGGSAQLNRSGPRQRMRQYDPATEEPVDRREKNLTPTMLGQGNTNYLVDVAIAMTKSEVGDGRAAVGRAILTARRSRTLHYTAVSTNRTEYNDENSDDDDTVTVSEIDY